MPAEKLYTFDRSDALLERARCVVPGGIYGHQSPQLLSPGSYPNFLARGKGCRLWDVDGNEYIDFMCSYGPIVLGHQHPRVEEAVRAQLEQLDCPNLPSERWVDLAELLVSITPWAAWAVFGKNGSDATSWSIAVARVQTGRSKVMMAEGAYHGSHPWCTPNPAGTTEGERMDVLTFEYNNSEDLRRVANEHRGQVAAIILCPFRHDVFHNEEMPAPGFHDGVRSLCDREGIVLILDDVRAGFRLHTGGSGEVVGLQPDLTCYSKAVANGYAISAVLGREELREAAKQVYFTGSFFTAAVSMAAAVATVNALRDEGGIEKMAVAGTRFREGLYQQARSLGLRITQSGPPAIPFLTFDNDEGFQHSRLWAGECARRGVFLSPFHNWFLCAAHSEADINEALVATEAAFKVVKDKFGG
jgi:glutamate-1-semialdehyde 2,1-aminomutase